MIADLLPAYYEVFGANPTFTVVRSMVIGNHEVAWMKYDGHVVCDITGQGNEGKPFTGHELFCECHFTKGVGWERGEDGRKCNLTWEKCPRFKSAMRMRCVELRQEYLVRFEKADGQKFTEDEVEEIIFDLIEKVKAGEFIGEKGDGASFWGGYFYLLTLDEIAGPINFWEVADKLVKAKKISLEGTVVQPYRKPPRPAWDEYTRVKAGDLEGVMYLPAHSKMRQRWKIEVFGPDGKRLQRAYIPLLHVPTFGPDADDVAEAESMLAQMMQKNK